MKMVKIRIYFLIHIFNYSCIFYTRNGMFCINL